MTTTPQGPAIFAASADRIEIVERSLGHPDTSRLLREFYREQVVQYGFADPVELSSCEYEAPNGVFAVVYRGAVPTGRVLLSWLERHAVAAGARRAVLETGVRNTAALSLFTSAGYRPVNSYVEGRDPAINRAFARSFVSPG